MGGSDEYGHTGKTDGVHWATEDSVLPQQSLHVANTKVGPGGQVSFAFYPPRPDGLTVQEWDAITQDRWNRIFKPKELA